MEDSDSVLLRCVHQPTPIDRVADYEDVFGLPPNLDLVAS